MKRCKIYEKNKLVDVGDKKFILYGISHTAIKTLADTGLCDVEWVIDSDPHKWDQNIVIQGRIRKISPPEALCGLEPSKYIICIFTEKYHDEIKKNVEVLTGEKFTFLESEESITFTYSSLKNMFIRDVWLHKKCIELNISSSILELIRKIDKVLAGLSFNIREFAPIKKGHKLCVLAKGECGDYVISYEGG